MAFKGSSRVIIALLAAAGVGCSQRSDFNAGPFLAPVKNTEAEASEYAEWQPSPDQLEALKNLRSRSKGSLKRLLDSPKWRGDRLRVTGMKDGLPVTESIGSWNIAVVPTSDASIVELRGLLFAKEFSVTLDVERDVLTIDGAEFQGKSVSGNSPMFNNAAFDGVEFKRGLGLVTGWASILVLRDGSVVMDFDKVIVTGSRAREYGVLRPAGE